MFLQRVLLKFHKPLGSGEDADKRRDKLCQLARRILNFIHQLQVSGHLSEGKHAIGHANGRPQESHKIAQGEAEVHYKIAEDREDCALHYLTAEHALSTLQLVHGSIVALQGLYKHTVLHRLLQDALYLGVLVAHVSRQTAHLAHVNLAHKDKEWYHEGYDKRQAPVEGAQVNERSKKQGERGQRTWQGLGEEVHDTIDIELKAVEHVAGVPRLLAVPLRAQETVQHLLLHSVLCLDSKDILHPYAANVQGKIAEDKSAHQSYRPVDITLRGMRSDVDGVLHGPYRRQGHTYRGKPNDGVEHSLQAIAFPGMPKPAEDFSR